MNLSRDERLHLLHMRAVAWDMYASSILSMSLHPRALECSKCGSVSQTKSMAEVAAMADEMLAERDKRLAAFGYIDSR